MADYQEINVYCHSDFTDILIAEMASLGFDTFQENGTGFTTFCEGEFDLHLLDDISDQYGAMASFSYALKEVDKQNWNEEWEKHYDPIVVENKCIVRAAFHSNLPNYPIELIITPKMSFGTGHHETTYMMLAEMLQLNFKEKSVMDAGTGTGVLAILAKKQGASTVFAFDIDDWCVENSLENKEVNNVQIEVVKASIEELEMVSKYDIISANINKNILLAQMTYYQKALNPGGILLLSGFYVEDIEDIKNRAQQEKLVMESYRERNKWAMARFSKIE